MKLGVQRLVPKTARGIVSGVRDRTGINVPYSHADKFLTHCGPRTFSKISRSCGLQCVET